MHTYGYVRVSSRDQNEARQLLSLVQFGVLNECTYTDRQSGKDFERPAYRKMLKRLKAGDLLVVKSIDRLGRNYKEILEQWRTITKDKKADIVVLDMPLLDTRKSSDLTGTLIADIVLQLLSYVAQTERDFIRQRQAEGIAAAKAMGKNLGRPRCEIPPDFGEIHKKWQLRELNSHQAAEVFNVSRPTFFKWAKEYVTNR